MITWKDDAELFAKCRTDLFTAVVGDVMDLMGYQHQFCLSELRCSELLST